MTCDECGTMDNTTLYRHAITNKRYCYRCWGRLGIKQPIPIDHCSNEVKKAAALAEGIVWKPTRLVVTQIVGGVPLKYCVSCGMVVDKCSCASDNATAALTIDKAQKPLIVVSNDPVLHKKPKLYKCALCSNVSNDGAWLDSNIYWCETCLADIEESEEIKSKHIRLKLRGSDKAIAFFHYVCTQIDNDWPWNSKKVLSKPCPKCKGVLYTTAILTASEIRMIAQQAGVGKCKIPWFAHVQHCFGR